MEITVLTSRYEKLLRREEELRLLKKAIRELKFSSQIEEIKKLFDIESEDEKNA